MKQSEKNLLMRFVLSFYINQLTDVVLSFLGIKVKITHHNILRKILKKLEMNRVAF